LTILCPSSIHFTIVSNVNNTFLLSTLINDEIGFDLHKKLTEAHLYLKPLNCHAHHIFKGVPKCLVIRIRRICSNYKSNTKQSQQLKSHLCKRGYKPQSVDKAINEVKTSTGHHFCSTGRNQKVAEYLWSPRTTHP
jgi:hypothetical protein